MEIAVGLILIVVLGLGVWRLSGSDTHLSVGDTDYKNSADTHAADDSGDGGGDGGD